MVIRKLIALSALAALAACGAAPDPAATSDAAMTTPAQEDWNTGHGPIGLMTRNLYLGADLTDVIVATTPDEFLTATTRVWNQVVKNDFHERVQLIADEIAMNRPDAVGLQEAYLWQVSPFPSNPPTPATQIAYDYIGELLAALEERGTSYEVAEVIPLFDFEAPTRLGINVRTTDRQAILVRKGTEFRNPHGAEYSVLLPLTVAGKSIKVPRGWTRIQIKVDGEWIWLFNTHTEAFNATVRVFQGMELAAILNGTTGNAILVGDLNSLPGTEAAASVASVGFTDSWASVHPKQVGFTCCYPENLELTQPGLDQRIDYVFVRGLKPLTAKVVGDKPFDHRTGLWPSDHAGLVATEKPERGMWGHDDLATR